MRAPVWETTSTAIEHPARRRAPSWKPLAIALALAALATVVVAYAAMM